MVVCHDGRKMCQSHDQPDFMNLFCSICSISANFKQNHCTIWSCDFRRLQTAINAGMLLTDVQSHNYKRGVTIGSRL